MFYNLTNLQFRFIKFTYLVTIRQNNLGTWVYFFEIEINSPQNKGTLKNNEL